MDGTMISLFGDYKQGRRYQAEQSLRGRTHQENAGIMPTLLPRTLVRHEHRRGKSYPQVEMSRRLRCTATPPPSLESQSLPKISLRGNAARQQRHRGNHSSSKGKLALAIGIPTIKCRTTQSLPSLSNSHSSGKSTGKRAKKDPQRSSTFDLFQTSRQGRRTAAHSQNFSWDFSPRTEVPKTSMEIKNNRLCNHGERKVETSRPVHLYMGVEMMDKLLEKRKGLRSDEMLNELIGLPPTKMRVSTSHAKKRPQRDDIQKHETVKDRESQDARQHPRDVDNHQNASKCREATTKESPGVETHVKTTPQKQPHDGDQCTCSNTMETKTGTASGKLVGEEDHPGNEMEGEFQDEVEEELGGLDDDEGSNVFDGCEDDNEEDDGEEIEEDDGEEIGDDDVDSDDEGRGTSQDGDEKDGEQEEEFEDAEDLEDGEAQGDSEAEEVEEEEFEEVGNDEDDDDDDGEEAEGQDKNDDDDYDDEGEEAERQDKDEDDDYNAADDDELGEGQGGDDDDDDDTDNDGDNENDDEEDGKTVGEGEKEEELDELENNDDEDDDMSDGEDDEQ